MSKPSASQISQTIWRLYLAFYSRPDAGQLKVFKQQLGDDLDDALRAACEHIVGFQAAARYPASDLVSGLAAAARSADSSPEACRAFQAQLDGLTRHPGRAKPENRLHRKRGCRLCQAPCRYGYFALLSAPNFEPLTELLRAQASDPVQALWDFTQDHLAALFGPDHESIRPEHLGNLAYCLLALATAKSRYPFPEETMRKFQALNQARIASAM